jgi:Transposase DDE domain
LLREHQLLKAIVAVLRGLDKPRTPTRFAFRDEAIVTVSYWSVICDRPTAWACRKEHGPLHLRQRPLPSPATLSRRLRAPSVVARLDALERRVIAPQQPGLYGRIDGKPLPLGGGSKDRPAGYGKAAGGKAQGYKLHALVGSDGTVAAWRVAPRNQDERVLAERLVKAAPPEVLGYLLADANFDANPLHRVCDGRGNLQLVTPRRYGPGKGTGHRKQAAGRLRSRALTESPFPAFAAQLLQNRAAIERQFGNLTNWGGGLTCLPAWVRTHRRVRRWVQAKFVVTRLKRDAAARDEDKISTCAA